MNTPPAPATIPADPVSPAAMPEPAAAMVQVSQAELADLRQRADRYRFLFRTIVTVTSILVGATLIIVLAAVLTDM